MTRTLTYWAVQDAPTQAAEQQVLEPIFAQFTAQHHVRVQLEVIGWADLYTRITTAIAAHRLPDLVEIGNTWSTTLQATGAFLPFDAQAVNAIGGTGRFLRASLATTGAPGEPAASVPLIAQSYGLFYNTALFKAAGIDHPPATWSQFVADARRLTGHGRWGVSLLGASGIGNAQLAFILGRQEGAQLYDSSGRPQFGTPAEETALQRLLSLMSTEHVIDPSFAEHSGITDSLAALAQGTAAMAPFPSAGRGYFTAVGFHDWAVAPLPAPDPLPAGGAEVRSLVAGTNLAISAGTKNRAAALALVRVLTSDAAQRAMNTVYGSLPVITSAYADPAFQDPATQMFARLLRTAAEPMPRVASEGAMETYLGSAISNLWAKAATSTVTTADIRNALTAASQRVAATN